MEIVGQVHCRYQEVGLAGSEAHCHSPDSVDSDYQVGVVAVVVEQADLRLRSNQGSKDCHHWRRNLNWMFPYYY
jgi:hypothetical protein